ncbi:glutaminase [Microbacterium sp. SORGH_AS_0862]|uniref:glutaminase n=1 Tax=Microbacterium sp. SORGH_AS_0862 TaxID=3041789 RepID=UPI00278F9FB3|nr:glutaminase [Microbacterium sp. SORGH_AS_0862]MDQ1205588.1 hypothetical protein [Microbacterium sp. SORGH_AS_0862]
MDAVAELLDAARRELGDVPREALGVWRSRRILGIPAAPRIVPAGSAWHLGVLLLTDDAVLATGEIVRAREEVRRGFAAESQRERAAIAAAAFRGGFAEGQSVHVGWEPIDPGAVDASSSPLRLGAEGPLVRWSAAGGFMPLRTYLAERVALARTPPAGA